LECVVSQLGGLYHPLGGCKNITGYLLINIVWLMCILGDSWQGPSEGVEYGPGEMYEQWEMSVDRTI